MGHSLAVKDTLQMDFRVGSIEDGDKPGHLGRSDYRGPHVPGKTARITSYRQNRARGL